MQELWQNSVNVQSGKAALSGMDLPRDPKLSFISH